MSATFVTKLGEAAGERLYEELGRGNYAFRPVPHARWAAKGPDANVVFYRSGKLVVQGKGTEEFVARHLGGVVDARPAKPEPRAPTRTELGSDESGKGDYFGPLTVAAACVTPDDAARLGEWGVMDSKAASDTSVRRLEGAILDAVPTAVRVLMPETYNAAWEAEGNLNRLLGQLHAEVLNEVVAAGGATDARIVVDRFGDPLLVRRHLSPEAAQHAFIMPTRAESHPAVAAASFLARAAFLRGFGELKDLAAGELYRGASDPRIVPLARRMLREGGEAWLGRFAKLHFKVTDRAR